MRRSTLATVLAAGSALWLASCREPADHLQYEDLVVSGRLAALPGVEAAGERWCADETRFAVAVEGGRELELTLEPGAAPRLALAACAPGEAPATGRLVLIVRGARGLATELRLPVTGTAWSEGSLDLAALARGPVSLHLRVEAPPGERLFVSDLWLRHRPPAGRAARAEAEPARRRRRGAARQILLVSVDTLRADAADGLELGGFAARAEAFDPHYAAASWTKPSHASLLTGQPVAVHGAELEDQAISPAATTLAERFSAAGFATAGLVKDCLWLDPRFGFDRGFGEYRVVHWSADQAVRAAVSWIARHRQEPFFYFLHLFTPHSDFVRLPYEGRGVSRATVAESFGEEGYGCREGVCASELLVAINRGLAPLPGEEEILRFLYGRGVATAEHALERLFADLAATGQLDRMLVVVTSDHGEAFFEHGKLLHTTVHEEILRVPLLVHWPGGERAGERRTVPTSSIDVAPTLLAAAGLDRAGLPGWDLRELPEGDEGRRPLFAGVTHRAVVDGPWKAIFPPADRAPPELYRLDRDPGERRNLADRHPDALARLRALVDAHSAAAAELRREAAAPDRAALSPEERRRLEALGYLN